MVEKVHMTQRGYDQLVAEIKKIKTQDRPRIAEEIGIARAHGDLSENAEYHAAKEKQGQLEARLRMIEDRVARAEVVDTSHLPLDRVRFGTQVVLENVDSGEEEIYTLIGEDEADPARGFLSVTSPVGRALIGRAVDDEVQVVVPAGTRTYEVREIRKME